MNNAATPGYVALTRGTGVVDLSLRGRIRVTGEDRARLLHAMTTNHVQQMKPGEGIYAFFLNAQGRIQADVYILCFEDHLLLDLEPETRLPIYDHLDRFIIADDATLEDITDDTFCLGIEGPNAPDTSREAGFPVPNERYSHLDWAGMTIAAISSTGVPAVRIHGPAERKEELIQTLEAAGAIAASPEDAEMVRLEHFQPRFGVDIKESTLPQETQQTQALHFQKGCYLGQEIIERIRSRGHVNRLLMGFRMEGTTAPEAGTRVFAGGKEAGEVTSATLTFDGNVSGLAYVRVPYTKAGEVAGIDGKPAELFLPANAC